MMNVNSYYIYEFLNGLSGRADDDEEVAKFRNLEVDDATAVKDVIMSELLPTFSRAPATVRDKAKLALQYYLTTDRCNWGRLFDSILMPFDHPKNPRDFFLWIWEVVYGDEPYMLNNWPRFQEVPDIDEPNADYVRYRASGGDHDAQKLQ